MDAAKPLLFSVLEARIAKYDSGLIDKEGAECQKKRKYRIYQSDRKGTVGKGKDRKGTEEELAGNRRALNQWQGVG